MDKLDDREISRYHAGRHHGIRQVLEHPALADNALELLLLRIAYREVCEELKRCQRTRDAYRAMFLER